jgi:hypothetical protein
LLSTVRSVRVVGIILLSAPVFALVGCGGTWYARASCESNGGGVSCKAEGGVSGKWIVERSVSSDFSSLSMDISGSTVTFPSSGGITLTLHDDLHGTTLASGVFSWVRSGSRIYLADPASANGWAAPYAEDADRVSFQLDDFASPVLSGTNSIAVNVDVDGVTHASSSQVWHAGGCQYSCDER